MWPPTLNWCHLRGRNFQLHNGNGSSHTCPVLDCLGRWQSDHTYCHFTNSVNLMQTMKILMGSLDWHITVFIIHLWRCLWLYCSGLARVKGKPKLTPKATITSAFQNISNELETFIACGHKTKDTTPLNIWRREALKEEMLDNLPGTILKTTMGKVLRDRVGHVDTILNWTELHILDK